MNYDLAKRLKDAGFLQKEPLRYKTYQVETIARIQETTDEPVYFPTLEELIDACGDRGMFTLVRQHSSALKNWFWEATTPHFTLRLLVKGEGSTPEEAVANLWLALQDNKSV